MYLSLPDRPRLYVSATSLPERRERREAVARGEGRRGREAGRQAGRLAGEVAGD